MQLKLPASTQSPAHPATQILIPRLEIFHLWLLHGNWLQSLDLIRGPIVLIVKGDSVHVRWDRKDLRVDRWCPPKYSTTSWDPRPVVPSPGAQYLSCAVSWWWLPACIFPGCVPGVTELPDGNNIGKLVTCRLVFTERVLGCSSGQFKGPRTMTLSSPSQHKSLRNHSVKTPNNFNSHVKTNCSYWVLPR